MKFEDFEVYFWAYINDTIVTNLDRSLENSDFCEAVCFDSYRLFEKSDVDINLICKLAENILFNVYRFKPMLGS